MGPDCGTAIVNGVGLGFANRVRRGAVGIVAASGTGLQAVSSAVHELGAGISQAFGTGGRDLKADVGGITALQALDLLARDPETAVIVLVSKPPAASVATTLLNAARSSGKPVVVNFIGYPPPARRLDNLHFAVNLDEAAELAVDLVAPVTDSPFTIHHVLPTAATCAASSPAARWPSRPCWACRPRCRRSTPTSLCTRSSGWPTACIARRTPSSIWARTSSPRAGCTR